VAADRKVTLTAGALANLTSHVTTLTAADMTNILNASTAIMTPYTGAVAAKISCLKIDGTGIARVAWGEATTGVTARADNEVVTIPANLAVPNSYLVFRRSAISISRSPVSARASATSPPQALHCRT
jgi:hypothetical protein